MWKSVITNYVCGYSRCGTSNVQRSACACTCLTCVLFFVTRFNGARAGVWQESRQRISGRLVCLRCHRVALPKWSWGRVDKPRKIQRTPLTVHSLDFTYSAARAVLFARAVDIPLLPGSSNKYKLTDAIEKPFKAFFPPLSLLFLPFMQLYTNGSIFQLRAYRT